MDFYFKYREYKRTLCSTFRHKGVTLNLYSIYIHTYDHPSKYVLVKNRNVIKEAFTLFEIERAFFNSIYMETGGSPELFNPQN